ncbi:putative fungal-specific transcription factor [Mycena filopes]|nr:putative fungal-specific transcription factor [Mycena filopes]
MTLNDANGAKAKQRRAQGACDVCKKRKIRCDGSAVSGTSCSHCTNAGLDCTHADLIKTSSSAQGYSYVGALEVRVEKMERLLNKLLPGIDFTQDLENENEIQPLLQQSVEILPRNDQDVADMLSKLRLNPENNRFFGKSSGIQLVQTAFQFHTHFSGTKLSRPLLPHKREEFWAPVPWVLPPPDEETPEYKFPSDEDLTLALVDLYFQEVNPCWPVLHQPTFDRKLADKLHLRDHRFAATVLMVLSLGARYSDDPRIFLEDGKKHSAGWEWYSQVSVIPKYLIYKPDLYELQVFALSAIYLQAISPTALGWSHIGLGLRRAQDVGAHRRRGGPPTAESEEWKRVFWALLCLDWLLGTYIGRPLVMRDQDFDQDLPVDCDDEYWDVPGARKFEQPKNKPSAMTYFIYYAKLLEIQAAVATTMYSPRRPKNISGDPLVPRTEAQSVVAFDSALNAWLADIPEHLTWDPARSDKLHLMQSALLNISFYNVQILLHRPYIPAPYQISPPGALPALAICTNAARNCVRIFDGYRERHNMVNFNMLHVVFTAGIVLVLSTWSGKKSGFASTPQQLDQIRSCIRLTSEAEQRYPAAGRYSDIMNRLLYAGANLDSLFEFRTARTLPPSAQHGYEALAADQVSKAPETEPQYSSAYPGPYPNLSDNQPVSLDYPRPSGLSGFVVDDPYTRSDPMYDFERQLVNFDLPQFPPESASALPADVVTNMWSTAPMGFHVDEWSYIMSQEMVPQGPIPSAAPPQQSDVSLKLHGELCGEEGLRLLAESRGEEGVRLHRETCGFWSV